ncbi:metal-binding protein [Novosphingobium indicum]|uniref:Metal-binding protein n=2 Tax=Novosphingobium indicum TaxID=462949 RepID=A0ABQ2JEL4_9SPHN|nr:metal-binding protein [Novosphingobium indicum]
MKIFDPGTSRTGLIALLGTMFLAACSGVAQAASYTMFRDPSCGCCESWAAHIRDGLHADVAVQDSADMGAVKDREGVPEELRSCHTMIVDGYVIEGHVPAADIARLLRERPAGVEGLAVAGMPVGSPGMEMGGRTQPYQVIAFGPAGKRVFASYP